MLAGRVPGQLVLQYTDACNARCPQCSMRVTESFPRKKLGLDTAKRIIDAAAARGVKALSLTGGEPLLYLNSVTALLKHAKSAGIPYTRTGTNGFLFAHPEQPDFLKRVTKTADALADCGLYTFWISIDSSDAAVHERMRGLPGVIDGIAAALPIFHERGLYPSANLGINRNMNNNAVAPSASPMEYYEYHRSAFRKFYQRVIDLGFTIANVCYPMSIGDDEQGLRAVYGATNSNGITHYSAMERELVYKALFHTIPEYRHSLRIFTPRSSLYSLILQQAGNETASYPCRGGVDYFFVDARDGNTYPCGYRGAENLGKFWNLDRSLLAREQPCRKCDWECFRDPSEMMGPVTSLFGAPRHFYYKVLRNETFRKLWVSDIKYFLACDLFNAAKAPDRKKLASHGNEAMSRDTDRLPSASHSGGMTHEDEYFAAQ
jgi:MoaA/NifB/PqqE/SkfB family radical SAM enzyme